jgi:RHS repeat-associated protein
VEKWRTTTSYGGDRTHVIPPEGGIATTDVTNALGQIVERRQYHDPEQVGSDDEDDYDATTYEYDLRGALTKVTDPAGNVWTYAYDLQGRQISTTDPDKGTTTTTYDAAGNVVTTTSPLGTGTATLAFTYDQLGRKTSLRDDSPTGTLRAEWIYDTAPGGIGKLARAIRYTSGGNYESRVDGYDNGGRATSTTIILPTSEGALCAASGSNPCQYTTSITYRQNGATSQSTVPAVADLPKEVLTYGYNDIGEPTTLLTAGQIYVNTATYNKLGQLIQRQLGATGSRVAITSTFDEPTRRLLTTSVVPELQPEAAHWEYSYDDYGNVTRINEAPVGQLADTQCFTYDYLARLSHAWTPADGVCDTPSTAGLGGPAPYWHSWTYDTAGNRLTETRHHASGDTVDTYAYPAPGNPRPHATTQVQTTAPGSSVTRGYTYDNAGNLKTRMSDDGDLQTYTFDPEGHIASVEEDGTTTSFVYDADGTRLIRRDASGSVLYLPNGTEVAVATGSSTATATRYYSHVNATIAMRTAAGLTWLVGDHHGTAELAIDRTTLTVVKRRSLPFGQERGTSSGWPSGMDKGFVGGTKDPIGLTHLGLREYEPALGRFISVDPVIDVNQPHQLNPYAYGFHNPVTQSDPNGDWPSFLDKAVSKVTSTVSNVAKKAASKVASAASSAANAVGNFVASTVESIKEDPLKFAVGLAVGVAATVAVAAVCSTGVGCLVLAGAVAGAATAGAEYGVEVAQGDREFSVGDLAKEMAIGGAIGGATAGLGAAGSKLLSGARNLVKKGGCNSFVAGTPVLLADGTTKPIEEVQVGDAVLATDPESGLTETEVVTATIVGEGTKHLVEIEADTDGDAGGHTDVITATDEHPFWVPSINEWLDASDLEPGQWLQTSAGTWIQVTAVRQWNETATVHNLTVSDVHTYYVLAGDTPILVHNAHCVDVEVYGPDGKLKDKWNETSGNMTPEEAALGRGYNSQAATHTENRVARSCGASSCPLIKNDPYANTHRVSPGDTVMIRGTLPPCYRCRGALNRAYRETGANYIYTWPSASGGTNTWRANGGRGFQRLLMKLGII